MGECLNSWGTLAFQWPAIKQHSGLLRRVPRIELLQIAGALQLRASTSGELIVYHRLAALGRLLNEDSTGKVSSGRLKKIIKLMEISGRTILFQADPPESPLTVEIARPDGPTTVFQGLGCDDSC